MRDTGIGIEPQVLPRIFDAFEQGERAITRRFGGLGLGLAISKALIDMLGGRLSADSAGKGRGAVFTIDLSATEPQPAGRAKAPPAGGGDGPRPGLRILLVDDHEDTARAMRRLLAGLGYDVCVAHTVAAALETYGQDHFDLLISDIGLPDGSGVDLIREIHSRPQTNGSASRPPLRGIALSGFGMEEDVRRSKEAGFAAHLTKPVSFQKLQAVIRQVTDGE